MTLMQLKYVITVAESRSFSEAAKKLYISQPSLSCSVKDLEKELGMELFHRTSKGVTLSSEGKEFIGYAKQVSENYKLIEDKYLNREESRKKFSVSTQHYTFAVNAFIEVTKQFGMSEYEFSISETTTYDVIEDVHRFSSEIGVLYLDDFNKDVLTKLFKEKDLEFHPLFECPVYVYLAKKHPLGEKKLITVDELEPYPNLDFDQGEHNAFYFSEEVMSTSVYKRLIRVTDRATILNMMIGLDGYTLCSGIICEDLNGDQYTAIKLDSDTKMTIGYLSRKGVSTSALADLYIQNLAAYKEKVME